MVIRTTFSRGNIGPSYKGRAYSYANEKGEITASWPSAPGKARSPLQAQNMELFRQACIAMKLMNPAFIEYARQNAKGKPMLPRDSLMAALYGRGPTIILNNGRVVRPMATRVDMSSVMDNIAWRKWSLLVRYDDLWEGLDPPAEHSVLTFDPVNGVLWGPGGSSGGSPLWLMPYGRFTNTLDANCKGNIWGLWGDITMDMLQAKASLPGGTDFNWFVARLDALGTIDQVIVDTPNPTPAPGGTTTLVYTLPTPIVLPAGYRYFLAIYVPGNGNTYNTPIFSGGIFAAQLSVNQDQACWWLATNNPGIGDAPSFESANELFCIGLRGQ